MFRNYLVTALRNLVRNRLQTFLSVLSLALGLTAALLALLYVQHELSYDRFIPGAAQTYVLTDETTLKNHPPRRSDHSTIDLATRLKADIPGLNVARLLPTDIGVSRGDIEAIEKVGWADTNLFSLLQLPVVAGDLAAALEKPDAVVLTRRMGRKYFGIDIPLGQTLTVGRAHVLQVAAVVEDFPAATHLATEIFASGRHGALGLPARHENTKVMTYLRLPPALSLAEFHSQLPALVQKYYAHIFALMDLKIELVPVPVPDLHMSPSVIGQMKPHGNAMVLKAIGGTGVLIVLLAAMNFVNLMTARSSRRAAEVGVRKVSGAVRLHLIMQFMGEALIYATGAMILAGLAVHMLLPALDAQLAPGMAEQWGAPSTFLMAAALTLLLAALAGLYPALVLSAFRPAAVLKSAAQPGGSDTLRNLLVSLQFSVLMVLLVATIVVHRQTSFALRDGLRFAQDQMVLLYGPCRAAFAEQVRALPGVVAAACSNRDPLNTPSSFTQATLPDGTGTPFAIGAVGFGYFETFGIPIVAGRAFDPVRDASQAADPRVPRAMVNEAAVSALGFASPDAAIGRHVASVQNQGGPPSEIIGVVPDFAFDLKSMKIAPALYSPGESFPSEYAVLNIKLAGGRVPETLEAIDRLWKVSGPPRPLRRAFVDGRLREYYADVIRQGTLAGGLAAVAIIIASLGLFGLSSFAAERRTKEIGIRKSMGASSADILRLLLWQFIKPVLAATVLAWPMAYIVMTTWLEGFAYHIDLSPWTFVAASVAAVFIGLATVAGHVILVSRAQPMTALRYE